MFWVTRKVPQQGKDKIIKVLHEKEDRTDCNNYKGSVARAGKVVGENRRVPPWQLLRDRGITPRGTERLPPRTINHRYVVRRATVLQELGRQRITPLHVPLIDLQKAYVRLCRPKAAVGRCSHALAYQPRCLQLSAISTEAYVGSRGYG